MIRLLWSGKLLGVKEPLLRRNLPSLSSETLMMGSRFLRIIMKKTRKMK